MEKVAIVILNWNGREMLSRYLPSVFASAGVDGVGVYVADNGSTDDSVAMLRRDFPQVHLILLKENHGFAEGYNLALQQVDAEYVVLLPYELFSFGGTLPKGAGDGNFQRRWLFKLPFVRPCVAFLCQAACRR